MTAIFDEIARKKLRENLDLSSLVWDGTPIREMVVSPISIETARGYIASFHYSRTMPDSTLYAYGGYINNKICGVVCYGMGCNKNQYTALIPNIKNGEYVELTRLWCADTFPRNTESRLISQSLKLLPYYVKLVVSFADEYQGHVGTIYQATNWYYCGQSSGGKMLVREDGIKKHPRLLGIYRKRHPEYKDMANDDLMELLGMKYTDDGRKFRYVFLRGGRREREEMYKQIQSKILPYPKMKKKEDTETDFDILKTENVASDDYKQISIFDI